MQRNTLIVFLILALGLGAYVYFYEIRGEADRQAAKDAEKQLFKLNRDDVSALTVQNANGTFTLTRQDKVWNLTAPVQAPADSRAVEDVIYALDALRHSKTVEGDQKDLTPFGLATPRFKVTATTAAGAQTLLVGDDSPFGGELYVMKEGDPKIYLTTYPLKDKLEKDLLGWRDKKILDFSVADVQRVSVQGEGLEGLEAIKQGDDWLTTAQPPVRLDASQIESMLYDIQGLTTRAFTGQTDATLYGLEPPKLSVVLEVGTDKTRKQLLFGAPYGEEGRLPVIRDRGDEVRLVDAAIREKLAKPLAELRDKKVVNVQRLKLSRLDARVDDKTVTATRDKDGWKIEGPLKESLKPSDVEAILDDLVGLRAEALVDPGAAGDLAAYGLDKPALEITLTEEGGRAVKVSLAHGTGEKAERTWARVEGDATLYELTKYVLEDIRDVVLKKKADPGTSNSGVGPEAGPASGVVAPGAAPEGGVVPPGTGTESGAPAGSGIP